VAQCREKPVCDVEAASMMRESILESLPEIRMQLTDDLLTAPPP
jgi:hypothetical protein